MKISELIEKLEEAKTTHGDIAVGFFFHDSFYSYTVDVVQEDEIIKGAIILRADKKLPMVPR